MTTELAFWTVAAEPPAGWRESLPVFRHAAEAHAAAEALRSEPMFLGCDVSAVPHYRRVPQEHDGAAAFALQLLADELHQRALEETEEA